MKTYKVTVNGTAYDVTVEEISTGAEPQRPQAIQAPIAKPAAPSGTKIVSPLPGVVLEVIVKAGDSVTQGQNIAVIEAMKMENEIKSTHSGTVTAINSPKGTAVAVGDVLITIA